MFQARLRLWGWKRLAASLAFVPGMASIGAEARAQSRFAEDSRHAPAAETPAPAKNDSAKQIMRNARAAADRNDFIKARELAERAKAMRLPKEFWDETPEQLLAELDRKSTSRTIVNKESAPKASERPTSSAPSTPKTSDPKLLVRQGRDALDAGRLETAQDLARQAEALKASARWGLFEDSPRDLLKDVQKAKSKRDRAEAIRLLGEARMLYEKKSQTESDRALNLEKAQSLAYQAERLHGPYSVWDFGDRPAKLLGEIETAKSKLKTTTVVRRNPQTGDEPTRPGSTKPEAAVARQTPNETVVQTTARRPATTAAPKDDSSVKARAAALMTEANALRLRNKFAEAHEKLVEARDLHAPFGPDEDSPEIAIANLQAEAAKLIAGLCNDASQRMLKRDPADLKVAEEKLKSAEAIAKSLGLDTQVVAEHRASLNSVKGIPEAANSTVALPKPEKTEPMGDPKLIIPTNPTVAPVESSPLGKEMLSKARLEYKKGETEAARSICVEVLSGNHGCKEEAQALLRSIDAEETNQRRSTAQRSFDTAKSKYNAREYTQALSILQLIDPSLLSPQQRATHKELMIECASHNAKVAQPRISEGTLIPTAAADAAESASPMAVPMGVPIATPVEGAAPKTGADSLIKQQEALQEIQFQKLRAEGLKVQSDATAKFGKGDTDGALADLSGYMTKVKNSSLDPSKAALLTRSVENRLDQLRVLKQQQDFFTKSTRERQSIKAEMSQEALTQENKRAEVSKLMKQYNKLVDEHKYAEAQMLAMKAQELDPDDPALLAAVSISKTLYRRDKWESLKDGKEKWNYEAGNEPHDFGPPVSLKDPLKFDPEAWRRGDRRPNMGYGAGTLRNRTPQERDIEKKLSNQLTIDFKNTPLIDVVDYLRTVTGLNITLDTRALEEKNISYKQPVSESLRNIDLRSALNIILKKCNLTHVIEDNALKITTEAMARGRLQQKVFPVADLVIPIDNFTGPPGTDIFKTLQDVKNFQKPTINGLTGGGTTPSLPAMGLPNATGTPVGSGSRLQNNQVPGGGTTSVVTSPKGTMEEALIKLITNTVKPDSWSEVGGPGTIDYYPIGLALVINQTPDVIEQVQDLLEALRRLQDIEISIEIRLITLAEAFFERIGLDFSLNIKTNTTSFEPQLTSGVFRPVPFINDINTKGQVLGLTPAGTFTPDLDIPIRASSFTQAIPPYGGFQNLAGNGGVSLGLAFLNDIQVFMFMEAAQGDRRSNIMQAPKLTMFNGQSSQITVSDQQFFVTGVSVVSVNGQIVFVPANTPFSFGTTMSVQPVVSADLRFVRLNVNQQMTNLTSATVPLFPITTFVTPVFEGGAQGQPIPFTQFVQQPTIATLNVQTTVIVPDGGTVMLGGLKTLNEGRNEFGPPVLSKIPYINRLFKNVGYGREAQTMMMMVTPRIIINREEQERQTGVVEDYSSATAP